jgi:hypothetical protein
LPVNEPSSLREEPGLKRDSANNSGSLYREYLVEYSRDKSRDASPPRKSKEILDMAMVPEFGKSPKHLGGSPDIKLNQAQVTSFKTSVQNSSFIGPADCPDTPVLL